MFFSLSNSFLKKLLLLESCLLSSFKKATMLKIIFLNKVDYLGEIILTFFLYLDFLINNPILFYHKYLVFLLCALDFELWALGCEAGLQKPEIGSKLIAHS